MTTRTCYPVSKKGVAFKTQSKLSDVEMAALGLAKTICDDDSVSSDDSNCLLSIINEGFCGEITNHHSFEMRNRLSTSSSTSSSITRASDFTSKRKSDQEMKSKAYSVTHTQMTDLSCSSSCSFRCSQKMTFHSQREQFITFWGTKGSEDSASSSKRKEKLLTYLKKAYDPEKGTFRFFTLATECYPSLEICEYAAAHCICVNPDTSRQWQDCKKQVKKTRYDSLGKEYPLSDDGTLFNCSR